MATLRLLVLSLLLGTCWCGELDFPPGFKFGVATAAYQIEGAWNVTDKGESIWDRFTHTRPEAISDGTNGDIACDSYNQYKRDVQLLKDLGVDFYRFSISWPRLLPNGFANYVSEDGKRYYNELIDELLSNGIEPVATLYHWDLPQPLQDLGGWTNPLVADWFADYARVVYELYADRVKTWVTLNEPMTFCAVAYKTGVIAPGIYSPGIGDHLCSKNALLAHAKAWRIYDEDFKPKYHGVMALCNHMIWMEPYTDSEEDKELAELAHEFYTDLYLHPIYAPEGGWPPALERILAETSKKEGYTHSRLPPFTQEEIDLIRGTYDYIGVNHYTSRLVRRVEPDEELAVGFFVNIPEINAHLERHPDWRQALSFWFYVNPEGLRKQMVWLKNKYGNIPMLITENGLSDPTEGVDDAERVQFYRDYLEQALLAIKEDNVNLTGYTAWSLMDNFEWIEGYMGKFGLHEVDFTDPLRPRTPRQSAQYYKSVIERRSLDVPGNSYDDEL